MITIDEFKKAWDKVNHHVDIIEFKTREDGSALFTIQCAHNHLEFIPSDLKQNIFISSVDFRTHEIRGFIV